MHEMAILAATGFGLGLSPVASGTFGTIPGIFIAIASLKVCGTLPGLAAITAQIVIAVALSVLAIPVCDIAEKHFNSKDDGRIVADEFLTFPVCVIGLPLSPLMIVTAFLTNRIFDIIKPPPARGLQSIRGGKGIVVDDFISCLYSLAVNHAIYWIFLPYF